MFWDAKVNIKIGRHAEKHENTMICANKKPCFYMYIQKNE